MLKIVHKGSFEHTDRFLAYLRLGDKFKSLRSAGQAGVDALARATPVDSGLTAASWTYEIDRTPGATSIIWSNTNVHTGVNVAVILQYGHGTGTGGYVQGYDYINPALKPIFEQIADQVWKEVRNA